MSIACPDDDSCPRPTGRLLARERAEFTARHPRSMQVHAQAGHLLGRVPMTWMSMWTGGFPVAFDSARGNRIIDVDELTYIDFALGDGRDGRTLART